MPKRPSQFVYKDRFRRMQRELTEEEYAELKRSIKEDGCLVPVVTMQGDVLLEGHHRDRACRELGIETPFVIRHFKDEDEAYRWALRQQLGRRNLSPDDFRDLIGQLYNAEKSKHGGDRKSKGQNDPLIGDTAIKIGENLGVSEKTVKRAGKRAAEIESLSKPAQTIAREKHLTDGQVSKLAKRSPEQQTAIAREIRVGQKTVEEALGPKPAKVRTPKEEIAIARSKANKTAEALLRAVDELQELVPDKGRHASCIAKTKAIIGELKKWS